MVAPASMNKHSPLKKAFITLPRTEHRAVDSSCTSKHRLHSCPFHHLFGSSALLPSSHCRPFSTSHHKSDPGMYLHATSTSHITVIQQSASLHSIHLASSSNTLAPSTHFITPHSIPVYSGMPALTAAPWQVHAASLCHPPTSSHHTPYLCTVVCQPLRQPPGQRAPPQPSAGCVPHSHAGLPQAAGWVAKTALQEARLQPPCCCPYHLLHPACPVGKMGKEYEVRAQAEEGRSQGQRLWQG